MAFICDACHRNGQMTLAPFVVGENRAKASCKECLSNTVLLILAKQEEVTVRRGEWD